MASPDAADPTFIPPATKTRTLAHMNKDHRTDLQHILQHYNNIPASDASNPLLVDMDLSSLTLTVGPTTHTVLLNPPMAAWNDRRQRLIEMTMAARAALGVVTPDADDHSHGTQPLITRYHAPAPADLAVALLVAFYFTCFTVVNYIPAVFNHPLVAGTLDRFWYAPQPLGSGADGFRRLVNLISPLVVVIHLGEAWLMDRTRLGKYGVRRWSGVWWAWVVSTFFEGYMAFMRIDGVVAAAKGEGEGKKKQ